MYDGKTIWFIVRGIAGHPSDLLEWEYAIRDDIIRQTQLHAIAISYATNFLTVWDRRAWRGRRFGDILAKYAADGWRINIISHSEGAVVATDAMRSARFPRVETLHLVCGACDANFERNGLNEALRINRLGVAHVWIAGRDFAMLWERLFFGKLLFGLSDRAEPLGYDGPRAADRRVAARILVHRTAPWDRYGHSECWDAGNRERTLQSFLDLSPD